MSDPTTYDVLAETKKMLEQLREEARKLDLPVFIQPDEKPLLNVPLDTKQALTRRVKRVPLIANNAEELIAVLHLHDKTPEERLAGVFAFIARNPGQAKKLPDSWYAPLSKYDALPTRAQIDAAWQTGELIAEHKFVKTPGAGPKKLKKWVEENDKPDSGPAD